MCHGIRWYYRTWFRRSMLAPLRSRNLTTSTWPIVAAECSALNPAYIQTHLASSIAHTYTRAYKYLYLLTQHKDTKSKFTWRKKVPHIHIYIHTIKKKLHRPHSSSYLGLGPQVGPSVDQQCNRPNWGSGSILTKENPHIHTIKSITNIEYG